jgi:hypothetical protein
MSCKKSKRLYLKVGSLTAFFDCITKHGSADIRIQVGNLFVVHGVLIGVEKFSQNWATSGIRFLDVPLYHHIHPKKNLLGDVFARAIAEHKEEISNMVQTKSTHGVDCTPHAWRGKSLRIPIDYVRIKNNGSVSDGVMDLVLGPHLVLWRAIGFWRGEEVISSAIIDKNLLRILENLMKRKGFKQLVEASKVGDLSYTVHDVRFTKKLVSCDPDKHPPTFPSLRWY